MRVTITKKTEVDLELGRNYIGDEGVYYLIKAQLCDRIHLYRIVSVEHDSKILVSFDGPCRYQNAAEKLIELGVAL